MTTVKNGNPTLPVVRAAIYVRQSVQEDEGIERQLERCRALAQDRGWAVSKEPYVDNKTSASKPRGPKTGWGRLLADIRDGRIDVVVAVNTDRLFRDIADLVPLAELGVRVATVEGDMDLADEGGEFQAGVYALVAKFEVRRKSARAKRAAATRRAQGHPQPGRVPYGFEWIAEANRDARDRRYRPQAVESRVVRYVFDEALAGSSIGSICRELNNGTAKAHMVRLSDGPIRTRDGAKWGTSTVRRMLLNPFYAGLLPAPMPLDPTDPTGKRRVPYRAELVDLDQCAPGLWDPIVSVDEIRASRRQHMDPARLTHDGNTKRKHLLSGIAYCASCGLPVRSCWTGERNRGYRCPTGHFQRAYAEVLDEYVTNVVIERLSAPDAASLVKVPSDVDVAALRTRRAALDAEILEKGKLAGHGRWTAERVATLTAPLEAELDQIEAELSAASAVDPVAGIVGADNVRTIWDGLSLERRRNVIAALCKPYIARVGKGNHVGSLGGAEATMRVVWGQESRAGNLAFPTLLPPVGIPELFPELDQATRVTVLDQLA